jgi:coenzyme F420-reducing hydrogenase alpha subunit
LVKKSTTSIVLKKVQKNPEILKQAIENLSLAVNILEFIGSENIAYSKTIKKIVEDWDKWMEEK